MLECKDGFVAVQYLTWTAALLLVVNFNTFLTLTVKCDLWM